MCSMQAPSGSNPLTNAWYRPLTIMDGRYVRFGVQMSFGPPPGTPRVTPGRVFYAGTCNSGIGAVTNTRRLCLASTRAQRSERAWRALSVAMPVLAYI